MPGSSVRTPQTRLQMSRFKLQVSHFKLQVPRFKLQVSHFKLRLSRFKLQMPCFKLQMSRFKLRPPDSKLETSHFKLRPPEFKLEMSYSTPLACRVATRRPHASRHCVYLHVRLGCTAQHRYRMNHLQNPTLLPAKISSSSELFLRAILFPVRQASESVCHVSVSHAPTR